MNMISQELCMNLPNMLTVARIILTFVFVYLILQPGLIFKALAAFVFFVASVTDYLDGYFAKKYHLISPFGQLMDPIADKFLMLSAFFIFAQMKIFAAWIFILILVGEIAVTVFRLLAMHKGKVLAAETMGKYKTVAQIVAASFILVFIVLRESSGSFHWSKTIVSGWHWGIYMLMGTSLVLTWASGISYFWSNRRACLNA